jgi:hypothetical protein
VQHLVNFTPAAEFYFIDIDIHKVYADFGLDFEKVLDMKLQA